MAKKKRKLTSAYKVLDRYYRHYFRWKNKPICVTCGRKDGWFNPQKHPKGIQVGHYVSKERIVGLRWTDLNVHPQCSGCNVKHKYNILPYTRYMIDTYGVGVFDMLHEHVKTRFDFNELDEMKAYYMRFKDKKPL